MNTTRKDVTKARIRNVPQDTKPALADLTVYVYCIRTGSKGSLGLGKI